MRIGDHLTSAGISSVDAEVLLAHILGKDRTWLAAHADDEPDVDTARTFQEHVHRRNAGEPVAYITGEKEFYGRTFLVKTGVLIPRPCTESLVEAALEILAGKKVKPVTDIDSGIVRVVHLTKDMVDEITIVDIGTGTGCIAISLACERPELQCIATDISDAALELSQENAKHHKVAKRIDIRKGTALEPIADLNKPFLIVTNPPYVTDAMLLADDVFMHEPREALMGGGPDGGDILRAIVEQAKKHPHYRGIVAECLAAQAPIVA